MEYTLTRTRSGSALRFNSRRAYNRLDAFVQMTSTCKFHFRSSEMVIIIIIIIIVINYKYINDNKDAFRLVMLFLLFFQILASNLPIFLVSTVWILTMKAKNIIRERSLLCRCRLLQMYILNITPTSFKEKNLKD